VSTKKIMIQGTGSYVGKSVITAALCSHFRKQGLRVAPFKAQNMSNNSFVTADGGEIGRAQAFQAEACGIEPTVEMNPILLKPGADTGAQVVVLGKPVGVMNARQYHSYQPKLLDIIENSLKKLSEGAIHVSGPRGLRIRAALLNRERSRDAQREYSGRTHSSRVGILERQTNYLRPESGLLLHRNATLRIHTVRGFPKQGIGRYIRSRSP
jgi:hypothetical protein